MAQKVITQYIDDLDGGEADGPVQFGLDGREYEIDLSATNAESLRKALEPYIKAGRRTRGGSRYTPPTSRGDRKEELAKIREWAKAQGHALNVRGRIPQNILDAYEEANGR